MCLVLIAVAGFSLAAPPLALSSLLELLLAADWLLSPPLEGFLGAIGNKESNLYV